MNPLVSVVVTTYNQAPYIEQALKSVLAQTYKPYEVIVVDDGSTDDTSSIIRSLGDKIHYVRQKNQGVASSRNAGIRLARGNLLAFLDGDDLWEPEKLSLQTFAANQHPNSGLIVVDGIQFGGTGVLRNSLLGSPHVMGFLSSPEENGCITGRCYDLLLKHNFISTSSQVMIPSRILNEIGLSDRQFRLASDYDLYLRIAAKYDVTIVKHALSRWRYVPTSASGVLEYRHFIWGKEEIRVLRKHYHLASHKHQPVIAREIESRLSELTQNAYRYGRHKERTWSTRYLMRLFLNNSSTWYILAFVVGLWCPERMIKGLRHFAGMITQTKGNALRKE